MEYYLVIAILLAILLVSRLLRRRASRKSSRSSSISSGYRGITYDSSGISSGSSIIQPWQWRPSTWFTPKGELGERAIAKELALLNNKVNENETPEYLIINDLLLVNNGYSTQIDHVVISQYGVFVIETKTMSGTISGSLDSEYWGQFLGGNLYKFRNPVLQNAGHINAIRRVIDDRSCSIPICSIIAFSTDADLNIDNKFIVHFREVAPLITSYREVRLPMGVVKGIYKKLSEENDTDPQVREKHIEQAQQKKAYSHELIKRNICPRCGGSLVIRTGKKGQFYGCTNYPHCRFTLPLSKDEDQIRAYRYFYHTHLKW